MRWFKRFLPLLLAVMFCMSSCTTHKDVTSQGFSAGFASEALEYGDMSEYYIAGYHNGEHPQGILDAQYIKAFWLQGNGSSLLLISVDCIALDSGTVSSIRSGLEGFVKKSGCTSVNVVSTHTHAGVDTLGLWGEIGINGKNTEFNNQIISKAVLLAQRAYEARTEGKLMYGTAKANGLQRDSRSPILFDNTMHQFRFVPNDNSQIGVRLISFAAHAESLGGDNRMISADFVGELSKTIKEKSGDELIFLPSAIGGLIMTSKLVGDNDMVLNMHRTAERMSIYILNTENERELSPNMDISRVEFDTKLENTLFIYYKFLGILGNEVKRDLLGNYRLTTELTLIRLGDVTLSLLPGEIFPELVFGTGKEEDGEGLAQIAQRYGVENLVVVGLANDEIGYIIPKSDFVLNESAPYVKEADEHYEETNSVGPECAGDIAKAFEKALKKMN